LAAKRLNIPVGLRQAIRAKCNGQCVMCGNIITEIDHIIPYSEVKEHKLENLTLLCTMHHTLKTKGQLGADVVKERTENIQHIDTGGNPDINFKIGSVILGNNIISTGDILIFSVENRDYLKCYYDETYKQIVFNAAYYDKDGELAFKITDNIYEVTSSNWAFEIKGKKVVIYEESRGEFLNLTIEGQFNSLVLYGKIYLDENRYITLDRNGISCKSQMLISRCEVIRCHRGMIIQDETKHGYGGAAVYGWENTGSVVMSSVTAFGLPLIHLKQLFDKLS